MSVNNIGNTPNQYPVQYQNQAAQNTSNANTNTAAAANTTANNSANNAVANPVDTFTTTMQQPAPGALRGAQDPQAIRNFISQTNHHGEALRRLVRSLIGQTDATGQGFWAARAEDIHLQLSDAERLEAQQMVSEDGFFGVQQTTDRIMGFAQAMVGQGASEEQIESMRAAVQAGFDQVAQMFGGFDNLPEVTRNTHASIMEAFDNWIAGGQAAPTTQTA